MDAQEWKAESVDKEVDNRGKWSEHCKTFLVKDAHGAIKELVFPKALDLDRPKRERTIFSNRQLSCLEDEFKQNQYLVGKDRTAVAKRLGLSETQVKVWFQNRRTKHKKDNERSGGSKDLQAESKAAQNVLKLLEYKTALSYNTFLTSTSTHFDRYSLPQANKIGSPKCATSSENTDYLDKATEKTILTETPSVDSPARKCEDPDFESRLEKSAMAVIPNFSITENELPWDKDVYSSNTLQQCSLASTSEALTSPPSKSITNAACQDHHSPLSHVGAFKTGWNSSVLENTHSKISQSLNSSRSRVDSLHYLDNSFRNTESMQKGLSLIGDHLHLNQPVITTHCQLPDDHSNSGNEQTQTCVTNKKRENTPTPNFRTIIPFPGASHLTIDAPRDYYAIQAPECSTDNSSNTFSSVCTDRHSTSKCARSYFDKSSNQNTIQSVFNPTSQESDVVTNFLRKRSFPNILQYPRNMSNMAYQQTAIVPVHTPQQQEYVPYKNMKHLNCYTQNIHGLAATEPAQRLEALQFMPVYHTYRDVYAQASNCVHSLGTPQSSLLNHPSVMALSTQYHGYPSSSWNHPLPECYQTD